VMREKTVSALAGLLDASRHAVLFTGAGMSTESGIPDYRSPGGVWDQFRPVDFSEFLASTDGQREFWRRKFATHDMIADAEPNRGHRAVVKLMEQSRLGCIITQNVDGLHQKSGVPEDRVIELHGNTTYAVCLDCATRYGLGPIRDAFLADESLPQCTACGGLVKTGTISFGQTMPEEPMRRAEAASRKADLMIAVGSSLVVYPAAGFPVLAKREGCRLVILNREPTELDPIADLVIHDEIGPLLGDLAGVN
jgi:NAD-dependent deacetylase